MLFFSSMSKKNNTLVDVVETIREEQPISWWGWFGWVDKEEEKKVLATPWQELYSRVKLQPLDLSLQAEDDGGVFLSESWSIYRYLDRFLTVSESLLFVSPFLFFLLV